MSIFKSVRDRYVEAKFESKTAQGSCFFQLRNELQGSRRVVVNENANKSEELKRGKFYQVFLERLTGGDRWIASLIEPDQNPWITKSTPTLGKVIYGNVVRYRGERAAIIQFDHNGVTLEAEVPRSTLPQKSQAIDIQDALFIGDVVGGLVTSVSYDRLEINLDLMAWLQLQRKAWQYIMRDDQQGLGPLIEDRQRTVQKTSDQSPKLVGIRCLGSGPIDFRETA